MDMSGFRMIPAGMGLMMPATAPWNAIELAFVFAMWAVMMIGMMTPSAAPMSDERSPPGMGRTALKADGSICASEPYDDA
jgi:predicted metal-binding membrane protein